MLLLFPKKFQFGDLKIFNNESGQKVHEDFIIGFSEKFLQCKAMNHSQKSVTSTVSSVTGVLTMQNHIKVCNKYFKN